jgi:hypothetical protein
LIHGGSGGVEVSAIRAYSPELREIWRTIADGYAFLIGLESGPAWFRLAVWRDNLGGKALPHVKMLSLSDRLPRRFCSRCGAEGPGAEIAGVSQLPVPSVPAAHQ